MALNRWTILAVILLLSTGVGIIFVPIGGWWPEPSPLMYVGLGLTILQTIFLLTVSFLTLGIAGNLAIRPNSRPQDPNISRLHPLRDAVPIVIRRMAVGFTEDRQYASSEYVLVGYRSVSILWWTYYVQFALIYVLHAIDLLGSLGALLLAVDWVAFAGVLAALYTVQTVTYSDRVSQIWSDFSTRWMDIEPAKQELKLAPFVGVVTMGFVVAAPLNFLYWCVWLFGW